MRNASGFVVADAARVALVGGVALDVFTSVNIDRRADPECIENTFDTLPAPVAIGALLVTRALPDRTEAKLVDLTDVAIVCLAVVDAVVTLVVFPTKLIIVVVLKTFDVATLFVIVAIVVGWTEEEATTDAVSETKKERYSGKKHEMHLSCLRSKEANCERIQRSSSKNELV